MGPTSGFFWGQGEFEGIFAICGGHFNPHEVAKMLGIGFTFQPELILFHRTLIVSIID